MLFRSGVWKGVFVRRIGPELTAGLASKAILREHSFVRLIRACAVELANIHLGTPGSAARIAKYLQELPDDWLAKGVRTMVKRNRADLLFWLQRVR